MTLEEHLSNFEWDEYLSQTHDDGLSNLLGYPRPNYQQAIHESIYACQFILDSQLRVNNGPPKYIPKNRNQKLHEMVVKVFEKRKDILSEDNEIKISYRAWEMWGRNEIKKDVESEIWNKRLRIQKNKRLLIGFLKTSYLILKWYKSTMEKMYHPDSIYVNTVLKNDFNSKRISSPSMYIYEQLI